MAIGLLALSWVLLNMGLLPPPVARIVAPIVGLACSLACPLFLLSLILAPGLYSSWTEDLRHFWERVRTRRREVEDLQRKIAHLDKPHHMIQLGSLYARQGKPSKAIELLERALEREPESIEAQYRLALCYLHQRRFESAIELLEAVHEAKPDYDYGLAYLRLAEAQQHVGNIERARQVYEQMLRFYPSHPEASYKYALLLADLGEWDEARRVMADMVLTVRHSPPFQRQRNRHWMIKARWWLWRHRESTASNGARRHVGKGEGTRPR